MKPDKTDESAADFERETETETNVGTAAKQKTGGHRKKRSLDSSHPDRNKKPKPCPTSVKPIHVILAENHAANREKGWRAKDLGVHGQKRSERFRNLLLLDVKELKGYLAALRANMHSERGQTGRYVKSDKKNPVTIWYLCYSWGVGENYAQQLLKVGVFPPLEKPPRKANPFQGSIIDNYEAAKSHFAAQSLFVQHRIDALMQSDEGKSIPSFEKKEVRETIREQANTEWNQLSDAEKEPWESKSRAALERHPFIKELIVNSLLSNKSKSYGEVEADIDHWCSKDTIRRWVNNHPPEERSVLKRVRCGLRLPKNKS